jgi:hypothetical protein
MRRAMKYAKFLFRNLLLSSVSVAVSTLSLSFGAPLIVFAFVPLLVGLIARVLAGDFAKGNRFLVAMFWAVAAGLVLVIPGGGDFANEIVFKAFFVPLSMMAHFVGGYLSQNR